MVHGKSTKMSRKPKANTRSTKRKRIKKFVYMQTGANAVKELISNLLLDYPSRLREVTDHRLAHIVWTDQTRAMQAFEMVQDLDCKARNPRASRFPGMDEVCQKDTLARKLNQFCDLFPHYFDFFPPTWELPAEYDLCKQNFKNGQTYIVKPGCGLQGDGIFLVQNFRDLECVVDEWVHGRDDLVVQKYIADPMLLNGYKFDFRLYVLITSLEPIKAYLFRDGLARICTVKYRKPTRRNLHKSCMHLSNYSLNKHNPNFKAQHDLAGELSDTDLSGSDLEIGEESCNKRSIQLTLQQLAEAHPEHKQKLDEFWPAIEKIVERTLVATWAPLWDCYHQTFPAQTLGDDPAPSKCFQIVGFDVMLDSDCRPWLLELNNSPSFSVESAVDEVVKEGLLEKTFEILGMLRQEDVDKKRSRLSSSVEPALARNLSTVMVNDMNQFMSNSESSKRRSGSLVGDSRLRNSPSSSTDALPQAGSTVLGEKDNEELDANQARSPKRVAGLSSTDGLPVTGVKAGHSSLQKAEVSNVESRASSTDSDCSSNSSSKLVRTNERSELEFSALLPEETYRHTGMLLFKSGVLRKVYLELCGTSNSPTTRSRFSSRYGGLPAAPTRLGLTSTKFVRFALKYKLFDNKRFRRPDADLLFMKISSNRLMGYERFCTAFFAVALRKYPGQDELCAFRMLLDHVENLQT